MLFGVMNYLALQPDLATKPAVVMVPQLILAELLGMLGFVAATVAAGALVIVETLDTNRAALERIANQTARPLAPPPPPPERRDVSAERSLTDPPRMRHGRFGQKSCPSCGEYNWHDASACKKCGTTLAMATPKPVDQPAGTKACVHCWHQNFTDAQKCASCGKYFPLTAT